MKKTLLQRFDPDKVKLAYNSMILLIHPNRIKIINIIMEKGSQKTTDLYAVLDLSPGDITHHLRLLHKNGILKCQGRGYNKQFSLNTINYEKIIEFSDYFYNN
jgi:DNA-binding transcriptional ArsR family regulator